MDRLWICYGSAMTCKFVLFHLHDFCVQCGSSTSIATPTTCSAGSIVHSSLLFLSTLLTSSCLLYSKETQSTLLPSLPELSLSKVSLMPVLPNGMKTTIRENYGKMLKVNFSKVEMKKTMNKCIDNAYN